jgi:beta-galactosidase
VAAELGIKRALPALSPSQVESGLPVGVTAQLRSDDTRDFVFLMNFNASPQTVDLGERECTDLLTGNSVTGNVGLDAYGIMVLAL